MNNMKLTHPEKAVLLEALEEYGFEKHTYYHEGYEDEICTGTVQIITDVGKLADRQNLINRIQKIESEDLEV